jgi:hypothetical protein
VLVTGDRRTALGSRGSGGAAAEGEVAVVRAVEANLGGIFELGVVDVAAPMRMVAESPALRCTPSISTSCRSFRNSSMAGV